MVLRDIPITMGSLDLHDLVDRLPHAPGVDKSATKMPNVATVLEDEALHADNLSSELGGSRPSIAWTIRVTPSERSSDVRDGSRLANDAVEDLAIGHWQFELGADICASPTQVGEKSGAETGR